MIKTYSELASLPDYSDRLEYLRLLGKVGEDTFGFDRIFNQRFYTSREWRQIRQQVILRDKCCDLACPDREILGQPALIHHINPITLKDIESGADILLDPENLVTVTFDTHQMIHYGNRGPEIPAVVTERRPNDTAPWKESDRYFSRRPEERSAEEWRPKLRAFSAR